MERVARLDVVALADQQPRAPRELVRDRLERVPFLVDAVREDRRPSGRARLSSMSTVPATSASVAAPFGFRASKISTTRGRPCVMSAPATPPEWNVRIVSCVPGSPIDCAAMIPTASPISQIEPVARNVP